MIKLLDGIKRNKQHPDTFEIPTSEEKTALKVGDLVKLCFADKERMWVVVTKVSKTAIEGKLDNHPVIVNMKLGDKVVFERKHIIGIMEGGRL